MRWRIITFDGATSKWQGGSVDDAKRLITADCRMRMRPFCFQTHDNTQSFPEGWLIARPSGIGKAVVCTQCNGTGYRLQWNEHAWRCGSCAQGFI